MHDHRAGSPPSGTTPGSGARGPGRWRRCSSSCRWPGCCGGRRGARSISDLAAPDVRKALRLSLEASLAATVLCLAFGLPLAWVLARMEFPGRRLLRALTVLPMVLPPVVGGHRPDLRLRPAGDRRAVPRRLVRDRSALHDQGRHPGRGVRGHAVPGRSPPRPPSGPSTAASRTPPAPWAPAAGPCSGGSPCPWPARRSAAGAVLCWARALGEFGATITFAGNFPGTTQTMPLAVYLSLESSRPETAIVLSLVLLLVSLAVLVGLRDRWLGVS